MSSNDTSDADAAPSAEAAPVMSRGRHMLVWALIIGAAVIAFVSTLTTWVNRQALDTQSWTKSSARLIDDPQIRSALSVYLVNQLYENVDVSGQIEAQLPTQFKGLAGPMSTALRSPAQQGVDQLLGQPRVVNIWVNANKVAHEQLVSILENETRPGVSTANGTVTLNVRTILIEFAHQLGLSGNLVSKIPPDAGRITILHSDQLSAAQDAVKAIKVLSIWLVVLVFVLWGLALYLARGARRATLRDIGWSIIAVGLLLLVVRHLGENYVLDQLTTQQTRPVGHRVWLIATGILGQIGWALILYGAVTVLGAVLAGPTRFATRIRAWLAPFVNPRPAIAWGVTGGVYLLLVLWGPTHALRSPIGILVFAGLIALGVYALRKQSLEEFPDAAFGGGPGLTVRAGALAEHAEDRWDARPHRPRHASSAGASSGSSSSGSAAEEIERLHKLHDAGALTDAEFERGKERALA